MIKNFLLPFSFLINLTLLAQSPRTVIVEHFTNTRCSICASRNPSFYQTLSSYPQVIHIAYHPSSPYSNCFFSLQNPVENDARTNFYGAFGGTPRVAVLGKLLAAANPIITTNTLDTVLGSYSPIEISVTEFWETSDSITVLVKVKTTASIAQQPLLLFAAIVEEPVAYNAPNGETIHHDVFRKALTAVAGSSFQIPAIGDSTLFEFGYKNQNGWNINHLSTVALVQNANTKEILNAARSIRPSSPLVIQNAADADLKIYPNPVQNDLVIISPTASPAYLVNIIGEVVWQQNLIAGSNLVNVRGLQPGLYFLNLSQKTVRIIKDSAN